MSAYASARTDSGSGGKKLSKVRKLVPDTYVSFCFGAKLAILVATNAVAQVRI